MVVEVLHGRLLAGHHRKLAFQEILERQAGGVDVLAVAVDEVHGHIEDIVDVTLEAEALLEDKRQRAAAIRVGIGPAVAAIR